MAESKILVYGTNWCPDCRRAKDVFSKMNIEYEWLDTDSDQSARSHVMSVNHGNCSVPTILFPDGSILVEPSSMALETKLRTLI